MSVAYPALVTRMTTIPRDLKIMKTIIQDNNYQVYKEQYISLETILLLVKQVQSTTSWHESANVFLRICNFVRI